MEDLSDLLVHVRMVEDLRTLVSRLEEKLKGGDGKAGLNLAVLHDPSYILNRASFVLG